MSSNLIHGTNVRMVEWYTHWFQKPAPNGMRVQVSLLILIWQVIDDGQTPNWIDINDSQTGTWNDIIDTQSPNWVEIAA